MRAAASDASRPHGAIAFTTLTTNYGVELIIMISRWSSRHSGFLEREVALVDWKLPQPWTPADATDIIRALATSPRLSLTYTKHAREQMGDRDLIAGDVLYVLKNGFVFDRHQESTQAGLFKYLPQSRSPNSGNRSVRLVMVPDPGRWWIKIVTVMWVDE